jgi:hypothetical protein
MAPKKSQWEEPTEALTHKQRKEHLERGLHSYTDLLGRLEEMDEKACKKFVGQLTGHEYHWFLNQLKQRRDVPAWDLLINLLEEAEAKYQEYVASLPKADISTLLVGMQRPEHEFTADPKQKRRSKKIGKVTVTYPDRRTDKEIKEQGLKPKLGEFMENIQSLVKTNPKVTAKQVLEHLVEQGYQGKLTQVADAVREAKKGIKV